MEIDSQHSRPRLESHTYVGPYGYTVAPRLQPWMAVAAVPLILITAVVLSGAAAQTFGPLLKLRGVARDLFTFAVSQIVGIVLTLTAAAWWPHLANRQSDDMWARHAARAIPSPLDRLKDTIAWVPPRQGFRAYVIAAAIMLALVGSTFALYAVTGWKWLFDDLKWGVPLIRNDLWLASLLVFSLGAAFSEELLFRGLMQATLAPTRLGFWGAAVFADLAWTGLHGQYSWIGLIEIAALGMLFAWLLAWTGSLRITVFAHAFYNATLVLLVKFAPLPV